MQQEPTPITSLTINGQAFEPIAGSREARARKSKGVRKHAATRSRS